MKRIIIFILLLPLMCISCFVEKDYGFPDKVRFPKDGGELTLTGERWIDKITIRDYDGNGEYDDWHSNEDTSINVTYDWLTVHSPYRESEKLQLNVEPNHSSKRRKLYITLNEYVGPDYSEITVIQD